MHTSHELRAKQSKVKERHRIKQTTDHGGISGKSKELKIMLLLGGAEQPL